MSTLDFGTLEKKLGATVNPTLSFAEDLEAAGDDVTITGNATVAGVFCTATHVSTTAAGEVVVQVSGGRADKVGVVTVTAVYSNGETQVGELLVSPV